MKQGGKHVKDIEQNAHTVSALTRTCLVDAEWHSQHKQTHLSFASTDKPANESEPFN